MKSVAIILASGSGERFEAGDVPKHMTPILSVPILIWTVGSVLRSRLFSAVAVVTRPKDVKMVDLALREYFGPTAIDKISLVEGALERNETFSRGVLNLLEAGKIEKDGVLALFDANRPFTPVQQIEELFMLAKEHGCSCPARPVVNGIARVDSDRITSVPQKADFFEFVTPEFLRVTEEELCNGDFLNGHACLVEYALSKGVMPATTQSSALNSKLTYPEDKSFLEGLAISKALTRPGEAVGG